MKVRRFDQIAAMEQQAVALLRKHFQLRCAAPHAVMLTGGSTPLGVYRQLAESPAGPDDRLHVLISDERHVPLGSPENNFARLRPMLAAMGLDDSRIMRVDTELPLGAAADRYHHQLASFFRDGGRITLGILGLGSDGHVASLFSAVEVASGEGRYSVAVQRAEGPDRVSVTRELILKVGRLVFLVAGAEKTKVVDKMVDDPDSVIAGQVVEGAADVELWFAG